MIQVGQVEALDASALAYFEEIPEAGTPEQRLATAIIHQAFRDCYMGAKWRRVEAANWLLTVGVSMLATITGYGSEYCAGLIQAAIPRGLVTPAKRLGKRREMILSSLLGERRVPPYRINSIMRKRKYGRAREVVDPHRSL